MRAGSAAIVIVLVLSGCAAKEAKWVRARDDAQPLKSATYWCTVQRREKFHKMHPDTTGRAKKVVLDEKCMKQRGWRPGR
jgi:hypothetical protein